MASLDVIVGILCAWRLTQLVVWDTILDPVTSWIASRHPKLDELLSCPHCVDVWVGAFVAFLLLVVSIPLHMPAWVRIVIRWFLWGLGSAGAVSMIQHATGWLDTEISLMPESYEEEEFMGSVGRKPPGPPPSVTPSAPASGPVLDGDIQDIKRIGDAVSRHLVTFTSQGAEVPNSRSEEGEGNDL